MGGKSTSLDKLSPEVTKKKPQQFYTLFLS